jgi:magnesium transporter
MRPSKNKTGMEWETHPPIRETRDPELAAHYVTERFPVVHEQDTVGDVIEYIREHSKEFQVIDYIYVVNETKQLVGTLSIRTLFTHPNKAFVSKVMKREIISVTPETRIDAVARLALQHHLRGIPVLKKKKLEGVILTHEILHIINRSLHEKLLRFSGIHVNHLDYEDWMKVPLWESVVHRVPWLFVGLLGVLLAAGVIDSFQELLRENLILTFFIPAILYMSNALGVQNQTLLIRDLALQGRELNIGKYAGKTLLIGAIISAILGVSVYGIILLAWGEPTYAFVIGLAMGATILISSLTSITITLVFRALKHDPAFGSGPLATILSDVSSILVYFLIVSLLL